MVAEFNGLTPADFAESARRAVAACEGLAVDRQAALLAADGLLGICAAESVGGLGLPLAFAVPVAMAAGGGLLGFPLVETILLASVLASVSPGTASKIAAGKIVATVAWSGAVAHRPGPDGTLLTSGAAGRAPLAETAGRVLVRTADGGGVLVETGAPGVRLRASATLDMVHPEVTVQLADVSVARDDVIGPNDMRRLDEAAPVLRAAAIIGASETCLAAAREHAATRRQFGKPLIANQAIRHHLARHKLALESARVVLDRAVAAGSAQAVRSAFAAAVNAGVVVSEGAIQLHGGMGFTWEVPLHFHLRQIRAIEAQADAGANLDLLADIFIGAVAPMAPVEACA